MFRLEDDMGRRRGQRKGHLFEKSGSWLLRWREDVIEDGNLVRKRFGRVIAPSKGPERVSKREAYRIADAEILAKLDAASIRPGTLATIEQFIIRYYEPDILWRKGRKETGRKFAASIIKNHILPDLGRLRMRDVTVGDLQDLISRKAAAGLSSQTVKHIRNQLSAIFRHAKRRGYFIGENPVELLVLPTMRRQQRGVLSWDGVSRLAAELPRFRVLIYLLAITGLRISEACGLKWSRLNLTEEFVVSDDQPIPPKSALIVEAYVRGTYTETKQETAERIMPLPEELIYELLRHKRASMFDGPNDPVFASRTGRPIDQHNIASRYLKPAVQKIGVPKASWHWLRHTSSSFADQVGMTLGERQKGLGHGSGAMTMSYTHADVERVRAGLNRVAKRLLGAPGGTVQ